MNNGRFKLSVIIHCAILICVTLLFSDCSKTVHVTSGEYTYETVKGDPLNARIYTLDNGLEVYMTVYKDAPRIQTAIPVRVGWLYTIRPRGPASMGVPPGRLTPIRE